MRDRERLRKISIILALVLIASMLLLTILPLMLAY